jgi:hypothetical protein
MIEPTKYTPIEFSILGVGAVLLEQLRPGDTVSSLWDKVRSNRHVRTFDRFAEALTLLFAANVLAMRDGVLIATRRLVS